MKNILHTAMTLALVLGFITACSDKHSQNAQLDPALPVITMSDLVKHPGKYAGKTVTVTGLFGGMCSDGTDFYFKDKLELIEVYPPAEGMPSDIVIGTPLKVQGVVLAKVEHAEESDNSESPEGDSDDKESEVKLQAKVIQVNRS